MAFTRRVAAAAFMAAFFFSGVVPAGAAMTGSLVTACAPAGKQVQALCYAGDVASRDASALLGPAPEEGVYGYERSWTHHALALQQALSDGLSLREASWLGTHNSFNSIREMGPALSTLDANQQLTLTDQLRLDMRSLELDLHQQPSVDDLGAVRPVVCHGEGPVGCSIERPLREVVPELASWLRANPSEVVLLYLENQLTDQSGDAAAARTLRDGLGSLLYAPPGDGACHPLPLELTRDAVRAAHAQVVLVTGGCGTGSAWHDVTFNWNGAHVETRPVGFRGPPGCGPDFTPAQYATKLVRYFEDSTFVTAVTAALGAGTLDDGLTPSTVAKMMACGVDLFGFDQLLPGDGRLDAAVWSWAPGQPRAGRACTVARTDGRWQSGSCTLARPAACRTAAGDWVVTAGVVTRSGAARACTRRGATWAVPRTAAENASLHAVAGGRRLLLALVRR